MFFAVNCLILNLHWLLKIILKLIIYKICELVHILQEIWWKWNLFLRYKIFFMIKMWFAKRVCSNFNTNFRRQSIKNKKWIVPIKPSRDWLSDISQNLQTYVKYFSERLYLTNSPMFSLSGRIHFFIWMDLLMNYKIVSFCKAFTT